MRIKKRSREKGRLQETSLPTVKKREKFHTEETGTGDGTPSDDGQFQSFPHLGGCVQAVADRNGSRADGKHIGTAGRYDGGKQIGKRRNSESFGNAQCHGNTDGNGRRIT